VTIVEGKKRHELDLYEGAGREKWINGFVRRRQFFPAGGIKPGATAPMITKRHGNYHSTPYRAGSLVGAERHLYAFVPPTAWLFFAADLAMAGGTQWRGWSRIIKKRHWAAH